MTGNQLPHAVLPNKRIGTEDSLDAVFAPDHSIITIGIGRDRRVVVIDANFEIADLFAVHLIVCAVFCIGQYRLLRGPNSTAKATGPIVSIASRGNVLPTAEGGLGTERNPEFLIGDDLQQGIVAQTIGVIGIFVSATI